MRIYWILRRIFPFVYKPLRLLAPQKVASPADILRRASRVPSPRTCADLSGKKRRPITADCQIWEVHFGPWEISRLTLYFQKRSERSLERWRSYSFITNYSVNSQTFLVRSGYPHNLIKKKLPRRLNLLNGSRLYYKTITCEKKILPFVQSYMVTPPMYHPKNNFMSKRHLIQPLQRYNNPSLIS